MGLVFDIKRFAVHDGPGIRTTVFLKGCPLSCPWCHNPEGISPYAQKIMKERKLEGKIFREEELVGKEYSASEIMEELEKDRIIMEESGGGVTFSGGEPLMQPEFLLELLQSSTSRGIHTTVDTSGFASLNVIEKVLPLTGLFLYDLKLMDDEQHKKLTGVSNRKIVENLEFLSEHQKRIRIRIPVLKGINDSKENIEQTILFLKRLNGIEQVDLLPYHRIGRSKYERLGLKNGMNEKAETGPERMAEIKKMFESEKFKVKIGG